LSFGGATINVLIITSFIYDCKLDVIDILVLTNNKVQVIFQTPYMDYDILDCQTCHKKSWVLLSVEIQSPFFILYNYFSKLGS
jgi:hypothetical protein